MRCACRAARTPTPTEPDFWSYCGSTHADRRDWVQPVKRGFAQDNFLGMTASDYGGGTPIVDVWRRDGGLAVGHVETTSAPRLAARAAARRAASSLAVSAAARAHARARAHRSTLRDLHRRPQRRLLRDAGCLPPHHGRAGPARAARRRRRRTRLSGAPGVTSATARRADRGHAAEGAAIWASRWAVIDDGWQSNVGDWKPRSQPNIPRGDADMRAPRADIRAAAAEASPVGRAARCRARAPTCCTITPTCCSSTRTARRSLSPGGTASICARRTRRRSPTPMMLVRRFIGDWGFAGLKIDGQHLNGVAPCYNPAHHHARPEESVEGLQDFFHAIYAPRRRSTPRPSWSCAPAAPRTRSSICLA